MPRRKTPVTATFAASWPRAIFLLCLAACLAADFCAARALIPNADSVQSYNEMLAIRAGNPLLHDWVLATDNYLLTDLPPVLLAAFIFGSGPGIIYLAPFLVFAALLAACLFIVRGLAPGPRERLAGAYAILLLLGVPYGLTANFYFWSDYHVATLALSLYAVLAIEPALSRRRFHWWRLAPFILLVAITVFSDPLVDALLLAPLALLLVLRAWFANRLRLDDASLGVAAALGFAAGWLARHAVIRLGGFRTGETVTASFVPAVHDLLANFWALLNGGQILFTARAALLRGLPLPHLIAAGGLVEAGFVLAFAAAAAWSAPRAPQAGTVQLLLLGAAGLCLAASFSRSFILSIGTGPDYPGSAARFAVPIYVFLCLAGVLHAMPVGAKSAGFARRAAAALILLAIPHTLGGIAAAGASLHARPGIQAAPQRPLLAWLNGRHLTHGVGDYWDTQMLRALGGGKIRADPALQSANNQVQLYPWIIDTSRFADPLPPQFVILRPGNAPGHITLAGVITTYGPPARLIQVGGYQVALFNPPAENSAPRH